MEKPYQPIDCNYYDRLEAWATTGAVCTIVFTTENGLKEVSARIEDLYTKEKVEYMKMDNGMEMRLDTLVSVNNIPLPGHC